VRHGILSLAWCVATAALAASSLAAGAARAQAQDQAPPAPVTVAPVVKGSIATTVSATGTVVSRNDARLAAEVAGRLDWVAEPGARIARGAPLARVDARALELQLKENDAQISRLAANSELLDTQLARLTALPEGIASRSQIDEASARLAMSRHELDEARAARESTRHLIARATIRAPFSGYVAERIRQMGEFVAAGAQVLRLTDTENVEVVARAPVAEAGHLAAGQIVTVRSAAQELESRIRAIVPVGDERSRMIEVRIAMSGAGWPIGSAVRVDLPASRQAAGLMVPRDAVIVRSDGAHVFRVGKGEVAERIAVRVGNGDSQRVEVTGPLAAGDRVVVRGGERLRPGQVLKVAAGAGNKAAAATAVPHG
jgi:multidrug efflux system membrane fusion protein